MELSNQPSFHMFIIQYFNPDAEKSGEWSATPDEEWHITNLDHTTLYDFLLRTLVQHRQLPEVLLRPGEITKLEAALRSKDTGIHLNLESIRVLTHYIRMLESSVVNDEQKVINDELKAYLTGFVDEIRSYL